MQLKNAGKFSSVLDLRPKGAKAAAVVRTVGSESMTKGQLSLPCSVLVLFWNALAAALEMMTMNPGTKVR